MTQSDIVRWLGYWDRSKSVALDEIRAFDHVYQARKYCQVMRTGIFWDITDLEIWRALLKMRAVTKK